MPSIDKDPVIAVVRIVMVDETCEKPDIGVLSIFPFLSLAQTLIDLKVDGKSNKGSSSSQHVECSSILDTSEAVDVQAGRIVNEEREPYGKAGFGGIFGNKYVTICAAFATMGGALFGYDQGVVSVTLLVL
ncbi:hypothetical protein QQZ08_007271 [Neonectria magnoliae]|uniref:Major facilitator superfamily (MFS) profile domain-containing protein n=1 Tax=Neonectria magnoliae TaxID=2732573 RepID=A0ABR1I045_9HYPO